MTTTSASQEHDDDMWGDLAAEFQQAEATPIKVNTATPINRRTSPGERLRLSVFSGFLPMLALCAVASVIALPSPYEPLTAGLAGVLAVVLAALLAPVLAGPKRPLWLYTLPALLVGCGAAVSTAVAQAINANLTNFRMDAIDATLILQDRLEGYLSYGHWAVYLLAAPVVALIGFKIRAQTPWLDGRKHGRSRTILALLVLVGPASLVVVSLALAPKLTAESEGWLAQIQQTDPKATYRPNNYGDSVANDWHLLNSSWRTQTGEADNSHRRIARTPVALLRDINDRYLKLLGTSGSKLLSTGWEQAQLSQLLLLRHEELRQPFPTVQAILGESLETRLMGGFQDREEIFTAVDVYLSLLATQKLDEPSLKSALAWLAQEQTELRPILEELDIVVARTVVAEVDYLGRYRDDEPKNRPLLAFGQHLDSSPSNLWVKFRRAEWLKPWLTVRPQLAAIEESKQLAALSDYARPQQAVELHQLSHYVVYSGQLRPYLQAGEILAALRLYKIRHGAWPKSLEQIRENLSFEPVTSQWNLTFSGATMTLESREIKANLQPRLMLSANIKESYAPMSSEWILR